MDAIVLSVHEFKPINQKSVQEANKALAGLGGFISLEYNEDSGTVTPKWTGASAGSYHSVLNSVNEGITDNTSLQFWSDCFRISAACLGSEVKPESSWFLEHPWTEVRERAVVNDTTELEALDCPLAKHIANKFCYAVLEHSKDELNGMKQKVSEKKQLKAKAEGLSPATQARALSLSAELRNKKNKLKPTTTIVRDGGCVDGKEAEGKAPEEESHAEWPDFRRLWELYAELYVILRNSDDSRRYETGEEFTEWSKRVGINQYIRPRVGDTLIIVPATAAESKWSRWVVKDGYNPNFHWAPVVYTTPDGYICLENFAVPDPHEINNKWEFRYYPYSEGGYHGKLIAGGGYGNIAMTLIVRMSSSKTTSK